MHLERRYTRSWAFPPGSLPVRVWLNPQSHHEPPHDHEFLEVVVVKGGSAIHESAAGNTPLEAGAALILGPRAWHAYRDCRRFEIFNCCFGSELLEHELAWLREDAALDRLFWANPAHEVAIATGQEEEGAARQRVALMQELAGAFQGRTAMSRPEAVARLAVALSALAPSFAHLPPLARPHPVVTACLREMEEALERPWTLAVTARRHGVSREHLIRLFREATGLAPRRYLDHRRARRAAGLLLRTSLSIATIGERVGWGDPVTFSRRFRAHYGVSATAYRRSGGLPGGITQGVFMERRNGKRG